MTLTALAPTRTAPWLGATDIWLLREGRHLRPWEKLGAHPCIRDGVQGTMFAVWAPNARKVSVVGDFNHWNSRHHGMELHRDCGVWELFVPDVLEGALYKFLVCSTDGLRHLKIDPYAFRTESGPGHACIVMELPPAPGSHRQVAQARAQANALDAPITIYEVHAGSWRRPDGHLPDWDYLAKNLLPYVVEMGFTHLELMPVNEHPFYGSWGYQPTGLYAPSSRYGHPHEFQAFVNAAHALGLQVLLDWVPAHFPSDAHALARFDGTAQYEHQDPREGFHRDWNTLIYNFSRAEVRNFLVGNALFWIEHYGIDGLRVDAVASMLYRDYSRPPGEWIPNRDGGRENYEAIEFMREANGVVGTHTPGAVMVAEESTAFPGVTAPPWTGGLGFHYKWNLGWMHDNLGYFGVDPVHRSHHHDRISFAMVYAYSEHFVLPLSHDEVAHGKGSLYTKMWGDPWQKRANLRALYALMYAHPGKKLLFMGCEFAQIREWNHDAELDWNLLEDEAHLGVQKLVRDLNLLYRSHPALCSKDDHVEGFRWIEVNDRAHSIFSFVRLGPSDAQQVVVVCNLTPVVLHGYRQGVPRAGAWHEILNTDRMAYGGSGVDNTKAAGDGLASEPTRWQGCADSILITLPPLGVLWLEWR